MSAVLEPPAAVASFTSGEFRSAVGSFATGVTVVTTRGEEHGYGMTANAFSSVSLDPPLVLVCVNAPSEGSRHIERNGCFAVNILRADQEPLSRYFASRDRPRGQDAFSEVAHHVGMSGCPLLHGTLGFLDCRLHAAHAAGDHQIFIGEVRQLSFDPEGRPLLFHGGTYKVVAG